MSSRQGPQIPLNNKAAKEAAILQWGRIRNPTVVEIARTILVAEEKYGRENIVIWKSDLSGAYTLLFLNPTSVRLMSFALDGGFIFIYLAGLFGWTGMPMAFEVVTRILRVCISMVISGWVLIYCDDIMGFSSKQLPGKGSRNSMFATGL